MTETPQQIRERLSQAAVAWQVRLSSGDVSDATRAEFDHWRQQSAAHEQAYQEAVQLWQQLSSPLQADRQRRLAFAATQQRRRQTRSRTLGLAVAASLVLLVLAGLFPDYLHHPLADYRTHIGEQTSIQLADGSVIHLNTDTAVNVSLSDKERRIELLGGEAEFEVAHDRTRPFRVCAGHTTTEALGTRFIVRYDGNGGNITLLQGKIRTAAPNTTATLSAGQQIAFHADDLGTVQTADVDSAEAWRHGRLLMNFVPLKQAIAEINRYRRGQIRLLDDKLGEKEVNIAVDIQHIDAWLEALERTMGVKVERLGGWVLLSEVHRKG
ncbi:FecR family protein [Methylovulum miyakonense]|uniref:FecR family protein n=1 Tax=Methylovulum miyakonense TaxID=645578 RepID=UPI0003A6EA7B|nr:FecR family protein [Methylovulum miyakonense]